MTTDHEANNGDTIRHYPRDPDDVIPAKAGIPQNAPRKTIGQIKK